MASAKLDYDRYRRLLREEPLPAALVDLVALERNVDDLVAPARQAGKTLRVATKSVRCVELLRRIVLRGGDTVRGLMAYSPAEALFLRAEGFDDILVAYPTARLAGARMVARAVAEGGHVSIVVDAPEQLDILAIAARDAATRIPVVIDVDVAYRPLRASLHIGVRRSPLREPKDILALVERVRGYQGLQFAGLMGYEAHLAGLGDRDPRSALLGRARRGVKRLAMGPTAARRRAVLGDLLRAGISVPLFNGGGTGSVRWSCLDESLTEVTVGSGFLDSHLFDHYDGLELEPAAFFALQVTRRPATGMVTCHGGGYVASGAAGADRLPIPWLPEGLRLLPMEGAGEVQTPLLVPPGVRLELGDPVLFRHAKAGELAEHVREYLLVRGESVESRAPTYRGAGQCFG